MIETLLLPFEFNFMRYAFLIGLIVAIPTALLSCFLVVRGVVFNGRRDKPRSPSWRRSSLYF